MCRLFAKNKIQFSAFISFIIFGISFAIEDDRCAIKNVLTEIPHIVEGKSSESLDLYEFSGFGVKFTRVFMDVHLILNITDCNVYSLYQGSNCSEVIKQYKNDIGVFGLLNYMNVIRSKQLDPFESVVIGVYTKQPYYIRSQVYDIHHIRLIFFIIAIILFFSARNLAKNAIFYYSSGVLIGVFASLLVIVFIFYRMFPKKSIGIPILLGGWSVTLFILRLVYKNFQLFVIQYQKYFLAYLASVTLISFAVCYKFGPPKDIRSINLIKWSLQLISFIIMFFSSQIPEFSFTVILSLVMYSFLKRIIYWIISAIFRCIKRIWFTFFPKYPRLLTAQEYKLQGIYETRKALKDLRRYCRSPEANVWKITSRINNPKRFAGFVSGQSHLTDDECSSHASETSSYRKGKSKSLLYHDADKIGYGLEGKADSDFRRTNLSKSYAGYTHTPSYRDVYHTPNASQIKQINTSSKSVQRNDYNELMSEDDSDDDFLFDINEDIADSFSDHSDDEYLFDWNQN